jgi:hypothetical protein
VVIELGFELRHLRLSVRIHHAEKM